MVESFPRILARRAGDLDGTSPEQFEETVRRTTYRRGFALVRSVPRSVPELTSWARHKVGRWTLLTHPDAAVHLRRSGRGNAVVLLGHAYDPERGRWHAEDVLDDVAAALRSQDELHALLDRLAGRFRLVVVRGGSAQVWHDAMGSAAVLYLEGGGACASHAGLLADLFGLPVREFVVPFLTSRNYRMRDVKYLPGLVAPFEGVLQLTPNTRLDVGSGTVERYWPREPRRDGTREAAAEALVTQLDGLRRWFEAGAGTPLLGLTGGTDSRGLLIACAELRPLVFSYARSADGTVLDTEDTLTARRLTDVLGLETHVLGVRTAAGLNDAWAPLDVAYRRSTAHVRGVGASWLGDAARELPLTPQHVFVRGFGGEILRSFYQSHRTAATSTSPNQLARTYDVNAGSAVTRAAFEHFAAVTGTKRAVELGYDPNDVLYWEHRMGVWGSSAMTEADLVVPSLVGYCSRNLYAAFLALDLETRQSRAVVHDVYRRLRPDLMAVPFAG